MKRTIQILLVLTIILSSNNVFAQSLEKVLEKHFEAVGQEKLSGVKTYKVKAKIVQMGMELPMDMLMKRPKKFRMEMEMQGQKMIQAFDGEKGWFIAPWINPDPQDLTGDQLKQAMEQADIDGELYNYEEKGSTAELIGKEDMEGTEAFNIKLTNKSGDVKNYFIDAEAYIILKVKSKINAQGKEVEVETIMGDYQEHEGVIMPMSIESKTPMGAANIMIENIEFDVDIDDAVFVRPTK